jgi:hypothetical protein
MSANDGKLALKEKSKVLCTEAAVSAWRRRLIETLWRRRLIETQNDPQEIEYCISALPAGFRLYYGRVDNSCMQMVHGSWMPDRTDS